MSRLVQRILSTLVVQKYLLAFDIYERHKFIGKMVPDGSTILDVGGSLSQLHQFSSPKKITTADIKPPADIVYDGGIIPVDDSTFDLITSIDVFEHVPRPARDNFISEVYRVAKDKVILSAPLGTKKHIEYEKKSLVYAKQHGIEMPYLEEHIANGLPTPEEIDAYAKKHNGQVYFSGNLDVGNVLFKIHTFEVKNTYLNIVVFLLKLVFNFFANILLYNWSVNKKLSEDINRFYLVMKKE